jgi:multimeric flavodoxin WrbA
MKITGVISSPSKNGNTAVLVREVLKQAEEKGAEVEEIFLVDYNIDFCKGCFTCMKLGKCIIKDDFEMLKEKLLKSDGIILSSPVYGMTMNARMKNFLVDRMGMPVVYTSGLGGKYFIGIATGAISGAKKTAKDLVKNFSAGFFEDGYISGYLYAHINQDFNINRIEDYPEYIVKAKFFGEKIVNDIKNNKKYLLQSIVDKIIMKVFAKKFIIKNIKKNKDGFLKAVYENLRTRKLIDF